LFFSNRLNYQYVMATKKKGSDIGEGVESALSRSEQFFEENQKIIVRIIFVILAIVAIYLGTKKFYLIPKEAEAQSQMFVAEQYFEIDSFNLALYGDGNYSGFLEIIEDYKITKSGNLSAYYAGISFLHLGQYEDAIEYLEKFKSSDKMVAPIAKGAIGDAYIELGEIEKGLNYYYKAVEASKNNFTTPQYLLKAAHVHEHLEEYTRAEEVYKQIKSDYPDFARNNNVDKYLSRVRIKLDE